MTTSPNRQDGAGGGRDLQDARELLAGFVPADQVTLVLHGAEMRVSVSDAVRAIEAAFRFARDCQPRSIAR